MLGAYSVAGPGAGSGTELGAWVRIGGDLGAGPCGTARPEYFPQSVAVSGQRAAGCGV
jgi:hypothetical protein